MTGTVCYATEQGLGIETRAFIEHGVIDKIHVLPHPVYENHPEWYPTQQVESVTELLDSCDRLFFMESMYGLRFLAYRQRTILVTHYEFTKPELRPDVFVAPSDEDLVHFPDAVRLNIPVEQRWRLRRRAETFVHNAGHGGVNGRNGTQELLAAMAFVRSPIKLIVRLQPKAHFEIQSNDPRVEVRIGSVPYEALFDEGDVFVMPDKFGGSFLSMQEAFAAGMPVIASDRPNNQWLPRELLIPVHDYTTMRIMRAFQCAVVTPQDIAARLDAVYGQDIECFSRAGQTWAEANGWAALKGRYDAL
jgi:glycosyltransferase involved in cell wall biosynthesis